MIFSTKMLKYNSKTKNARIYNEDVEVFHHIDKVNNSSVRYDERLINVLSYASTDVDKIFNDKVKSIDNLFRTNRIYNFVYNNDIENIVKHKLYDKFDDSYELATVCDSPKMFIRKLKIESLIIDIGNLVKELKKFILTIQDYISKDYTINTINNYINKYTENLYSSDMAEKIDNIETYLDNYNKTKMTSEELLQLFNVNPILGYKILSNQSKYISNYFYDLASSLRGESLNIVIDNYDTVIRSKVMSVVNDRINLISYLIDIIKKQCTIYCNEVELICDQNVKIMNYLYNNCQDSNSIDARDIVKDPENNIIEYTLFEPIYSGYSQAINEFVEIETLTESVGLMAIQEADKQTLMQYMTKVTQGISKAWNAFQAKTNDLRKKAIQKFTEKFKQKAAELPNDLQFEVKNFPELDETKFNLVKVQPFNYQEMKEALKSSETFIAKYYGIVNVGQGENFKVALERFFIKSTNNIGITKEYILKSVIPILESKDTVIDESIKADIETTNKSSEAISRLNTNQNAGTQTPQIDTNNKEVSAKGESTDILTEVETNKNSSDKVEIVDDPNRTASADKNSVLKDVSVYLTVSASILSTKMKLTRQKMVLAFRILAHAFAPPKKNKEENNT